jgi:transcriptional regulator with GAF, ATPase, and Fis domain
MNSAEHHKIGPPVGEDPGIVLFTELDALAHRVIFDLGVVAVLCGGWLEVRAARGALASLVPVGRTVPRSSGGDDDSSDLLAALALPAERQSLVEPLVVDGRPVGTLVLVRTSPQPFEREDIEAAACHARILALAIHAAVLREQIERLRTHGDERVSLLEIELRGDTLGVLENSLNPAVQQVAWRARQVAPTDTPVLILGETGVGKEWLARAVHHWSARQSKPFVKMNCAAIAAGVLDSELFGHEKGAFTGATQRRPGRFQIADGGTLLLDEIGELPLEVQAKLLRVLQDGTFFAVGSDRVAQVDVRILAATHVDLERAIAERTFRSDLFYRLNVFPLRLPLLRERIEDLPALCEILLAQQAARTGRRAARVTPEGLEKLAGYDWPGNLRELCNVLERATILSRDIELGPEVLDLPERAQPPAPAAIVSPLPIATLADAERQHIERVLAHTGGKVYGEGGAAKILGLKPSTLQSRMRKLGLRRVISNGGSPP